MKTLFWSVAVVSFLVGCGPGTEGGADAGTGGGAGGSQAGGGVGGSAGGGSAGGGAGGSGGSGGGVGVGGGSGGGGGGTGGVGGGSGGGLGGSGGGLGGSGGGSGTSDGGCAGLIYCEDFEGLSGVLNNNDVVGAWKASVGGPGTSMKVDGVKPRNGARSLHITVPVADAGARATLNQLATAGLIPGNNLFGRAEIFYSSDAGYGLPIGVHSWFFNAGGKAVDGGSSTINLGGGGTKLQLNYHPQVPAVEQSVQGGVMTAGQWHCIQWQYDGSGNPPKNEARVWVDGTLAVSTLTPPKSWDFAKPWTTMDFGFTHYQVLSNPIDIYLDDFALDNAMIPCPP